MWLYGQGFPKATDGYQSTGLEQWLGWKTPGLKPAYEAMWMIQKPFTGSAKDNVVKHGVGYINIDATRIGTEGGTERDGKANMPNKLGWQNMKGHGIKNINQGRFPANVILECTCPDGYYTEEKVSTHANGKGCTGDKGIYGKYGNIKGGNERKVKSQVHQSGCVCFDLDSQSGNRPGGCFPEKRGASAYFGLGDAENRSEKVGKINDKGGASRFFYQAKVSTRERNMGMGDETNTHPTLKPIKLMEYLIKMITPPNGIVLDPFAGSGSTGLACIKGGFRYVLIEREPEYVKIIRRRIKGVKI